MKINLIRTSGFEKLYAGYKISQDNKMNGYGKDFFHYLEHIMVSISLSDLSTMELFYLKKSCSIITVSDKSYSNFIHDEKIDVYTSVDNLLRVHDEIINDSDIDKNITTLDNMLPIGCIQYSAIATYTGSGILSLIGNVKLENLFRDENGKIDENYPGDLVIENSLAKIFLESFYSYMYEQISPNSIDLVTDFSNQKFLYKYADAPCSLAFVNTPFGAIDFLGVNNDKLNYQLKRVIDARMNCPLDIFDITNFTFVMNTTFDIFFKFFIGSNFVVDYQNLKLVSLDTDVFIGNHISDKYGNRIESVIDSIHNARDRLVTSENIDLNQFNYILNGNKIVYSIQFPYSKYAQVAKLLNVNKDEYLSIFSTLKTSVDTVVKTISL